jgi:hypothetical protein
MKEMAGRRCRRGRGRREHTAKCEEDLPPPTRVVGGCRVQHDGHEGPDVVKSGGLCVEGGDVVDV